MAVGDIPPNARWSDTVGWYIPREDSLMPDPQAPEIAECEYPNCIRECADGPCPARRDDAAPICKDKGGQIGMNGECLYCTAEAGESCR